MSILITFKDKLLMDEQNRNFEISQNDYKIFFAFKDSNMVWRFKKAVELYNAGNEEEKDEG